MYLEEKDIDNIIYLILQFLGEEGFPESLHILEMESKLFFNVEYLSQMMFADKQEEAKKYVTGFMGEVGGRFFFAQCQQKFREVMDRYNLGAKAIEDCFGIELEQPGMDDFSADLEHLALRFTLLINKLNFPPLNKSALLTLIKFVCPNRPEGKRTLLEDAIFLVLNFLSRRRYCMTQEKLEQEAKIYFDMVRFWAMTDGGRWDEAKDYLSAFTRIYDNRYSTKMFLGLEKLKDPKTPDRRTTLRCIQNIACENPALRPILLLPTMEDLALENLIKLIMSGCFFFKTVSYPNKIFSLRDIPTVPVLCVDRPSVFDDPPVDPDDDDDPTRSVVLPSDLQITHLLDPPKGKIARLAYLCSADLIVALFENGIHSIWPLDINKLWSQPQGRPEMRNEVEINVQDAVSCLASEGSHLFSGSGGGISVFNLENSERLPTFVSPPPSVTYFTLLPQQMIAVGFDNGLISIYELSTKEGVSMLDGHQQKKIICLAFSNALNVLVSWGDDSQLCVWSRGDWAKVKSQGLENACGEVPDSPILRDIQFDRTQCLLLVVGRRQIDIFKGAMLVHVNQWAPQNKHVMITSATYACDSETIYVCLRNGFIEVVDSKTLASRCRIHFTAYSGFVQSLQEYPVVIAAHPVDPNQIAVGFSNGMVRVLEPLESKVEW